MEDTKEEEKKEEVKENNEEPKHEEAKENNEEPKQEEAKENNEEQKQEEVKENNEEQKQEEAKENNEEQKQEEAKENNEVNAPQEQKPPEANDQNEINNEIKPEENQIQTENNVQNKNEIHENTNNNNQDNNQNNNQNQINAENQAKLEQEKQQKEIKAQKDKIVSIIKGKISQLVNNYNFTMHYEELLYKILFNLDELTYDKITNSLNDCFSYLHFFKNSSELYSKFAEQIQNSNKLITFTEKKPKINDDFLSGVMQNTQNIVYQNLSRFSEGLNKNIVSKGPLSKLQEKKNQMELMKKTHLKKYNDIIDEKKKLEKKYKSYFKLFSSFIPEIVPQNPKGNNNIIIDPMPELIDAPDFVYIIKDFLESLNALINKINIFVKEAKQAMKEINNIFIDVNNLIKESITIYINESKIFFNTEVTNKFQEIENYFKKSEQNAKENNIFKLSKIYHDEKSQENIINLLQQLFSLLNTSNTVKKDLIQDKNNFTIKKYANVDLFFDWLISILSSNFVIKVDDLIIKKMEIKRDPGLFKKWKQCGMVITRQKHLIIFDNVDSFKIEDIVKIFEMDKITFRRKEDKKKGFLFEIIANTKGKIMSFKGDYVFDALSEENVKDISDLINNNK